MAKVLSTDKQIAVIAALVEGPSTQLIGRTSHSCSSGMPKRPKPRKPGRPRLARGSRKGQHSAGSVQPGRPAAAGGGSQGQQ